MPANTQTTRAELVLHPVRLRIIAAVLGRELTTQQIAERLPDVPQASLYRQIKRLLEAEMLTVVQERLVNGIVERTYALREGVARLSREEFAAIAPEEHARYFNIFLGVMAARLERYLAQPAYDTTREGTTYFQATLYQTDEEARQMRLDLLQLVERAGKNRPAPGRKPRTLAASYIPEVMADLPPEPEPAPEGTDE